MADDVLTNDDDASLSPEELLDKHAHQLLRQLHQEYDGPEGNINLDSTVIIKLLMNALVIAMQTYPDRITSRDYARYRHLIFEVKKYLEEVFGELLQEQSYED